MQRRANQLSAVLAVALAVAMPTRAEQADTTMGVGLRIVASDRSDAASDPDGTSSRRPHAEDTVVLSHGVVIAHGRRARVQRSRDPTGRPVDVVTY